MSGKAFTGYCDTEGRVVYDIPEAVRGYRKHKFAGKRIEVEFRDPKERRSDKQNRAYHAAVKPWADDLGDDVESVKDDMLGLVFGYLDVTSKLTGEVKRVLVEPHTSKLNTAKFCELMERTVIEAARCGYVMEMPDEFKERRQKEQAAVA